ncbi:MAG: nucleotide-binding protein [Sphingobacteriales bacterium]|nr:nucleotide-binding protein [Sphingobacteriales bacterium]
MAKRQTAQSVPIPVALTTNKEEFKEVLSERINEGKGLKERQVQTAQDLEKFRKDYGEWNTYNSEYLKYSFNNPQSEYKRGYDEEGYSFMGRLGRYTSEVDDYKDLIQRRVNNLERLLKVTDLLKSEAVIGIGNIREAKSRDVTKTEVFIVHGHDETAKVKAARFIEKLGFKPIILHEQASSGKTIIEKIEEYSNVGFGIVLYTPCDIGGKNAEKPNLKLRARQNVVFEHGYLIGKIGRSNVCALVKGEIETPNDISGVVYVPMDDSDAWHLLIARELKKSGYDVDMNKVI